MVAQKVVRLSWEVPETGIGSTLGCHRIDDVGLEFVDVGGADLVENSLFQDLLFVCGHGVVGGSKSGAEHHRPDVCRRRQPVGASDRFEGMAAEIERAGYEVVICLDISAYAQVRESSHRRLEFPETKAPDTREEPLSRLLTAKDLKFLEALKIKS